MGDNDRFECGAGLCDKFDKYPITFRDEKDIDETSYPNPGAGVEAAKKQFGITFL